MKAKETKKEESESEDRERRTKRERIKLAHDGSLYRNEKLWKGRPWLQGFRVGRGCMSRAEEPQVPSEPGRPACPLGC